MTPSEWPPPHLATIRAKQKIWGAWATSDTTVLGEVYGNSGLVAQVGLFEKVRRFFMGTTPPPGQQNTAYHLPIGAGIVQTASELLFAEAINVSVPTGATTTQHDALTDLLTRTNMVSSLAQGAEIAAAKGGVLARLYWDENGTGFDWVHPDRVTFVEDGWPRIETRIGSTKNGTVWRHFETHGPGWIEHALYEGTEAKLGKRVPLTDRTETAGLVVDENGVIWTGIDKPTAVYIQNKPGNDGYGVSDLDGVEHLLDAANEAFTSWMRDVRLSKASILVPQALLETRGPGQGATHNLDREVFVGVNAMADSMDITSHQFGIRTAEFKATLDEIRRSIYDGAGYSPYTFGLTDSVAITATEVAARERKTMTTRERKTRAWTAAIIDLIAVLWSVEYAQFGGPAPLPVTVGFPDGVSPTPQETATEITALRGAGVMSIESGVRRTNPAWTDEEVDAEVEKILSETRGVDDPFTAPE